MTERVRDFMTIDPITVAQSASVREAARAMRDSDVGDVIVLDDSQQLCGIVTDRDLAIRVIAEGMDPAETNLAEICSRQVEALSPVDEVGDAIKLMRRKAIRRLPILEDGKPVGIVSLGDLAATLDPDSPLADISTAPPNR